MQRHPGPSRWDGSPDMRYKANVDWFNRNKKGTPKLVTATIRKEPIAPPKYSYRLHGDGITFTRDNKDLPGTCFGISRSNSNISCGVCQIYGVAGLQRIREYNIPKEVAKVGIKALLTHVMRGYGIACISNNNGYTFINGILDEICSSMSPWTRNPNSGNQIRVWTFIK